MDKDLTKQSIIAHADRLGEHLPQLKQWCIVAIDFEGNRYCVSRGNSQEDNAHMLMEAGGALHP